MYFRRVGLASRPDLRESRETGGAGRMPVTDGVVEVAVPRPLRRVFDYAVPTGEPVPPVGARVRVPFGRTEVVGVVAGDRPGSKHRLKTITEVIDPNGFLPPDLVELAVWLSRYYHHPVGEVFGTMLPAVARRGEAARLRPSRCWLAQPEGTVDRAPRQAAALSALRAFGGPVAATVVRPLGIDRRALAALVRKGLVAEVEERPEYRVRTSPFDLNDEQRRAVEVIADAAGDAGTVVLEGVTGSGKTEVYMRAIAEVVARGGQALVLVPEIGLTPQTLARFRERFGGAAPLHSAEPDAVRFDTWLRCANGQHKVLVGTRSAIFAPFSDLRLIVVDEEHDSSFKQQEGLRYSARDVAVKRGRILGVPVVLGSATPALQTLDNAARGRYGRALLTRRAGQATLPRYRVLDVRGQRLRDGLSDRLVGVLDQHLRAGNQALVFVNRRGFAPTCLCTSCGWQARCDSCDARLTLHETPPGLRCHHCGRRYRLPDTCPSCAAPSLIGLGTGTQRLESALGAQFPDVPLYRFDRDTTRGPARFDAQFELLRRGGPAILVGTQMLAKGHHLPAVTVVAVIDADSGFLSADFRAPERTAQLIVQVAGRAGRAERPGEVWIQTYDPANANLRALVEEGYRGFAETETAHRREAGLPPFAAMAVLRAESAHVGACEAVLERARAVLREALRAGAGRWDVLGPAPAPMARRSGRLRFQCLVLASRRPALHAALARLEQAEIQASNVRWSIDVDPYDTF
ncbi:MAG: primosomal protein N' [Gammaproteobacteria bacterium]|nr:primosomal protein N' [Gammaproteobacteria bacterium]